MHETASAPMLASPALATLYRRVETYGGQVAAGVETSEQLLTALDGATDRLQRALYALRHAPADRLASEGVAAAHAELQRLTHRLGEAVHHLGPLSEATRLALVEAERVAADQRVLAEARDISTSQLTGGVVATVEA